jgi:hypothetical protein
MTIHLSLVRGEARAAPAFDPPPLALNERTQRPGELAELVAVELPAAVYERVEALATEARLPLSVWAVIVLRVMRRALLGQAT